MKSWIDNWFENLSEKEQLQSVIYVSSSFTVFPSTLDKLSIEDLKEIADGATWDDFDYADKHEAYCEMKNEEDD